MCMAHMMLEAPQLLILDEISNHLDVESVEALIYGLNEWNATTTKTKRMKAAGVPSLVMEIVEEPPSNTCALASPLSF